MVNLHGYIISYVRLLLDVFKTCLFFKWLIYITYYNDIAHMYEGDYLLCIFFSSVNVRIYNCNGNTLMLSKIKS